MVLSISKSVRLRVSMDVRHRRTRRLPGQMSVELMVVLPVALALALVVVNTLTFLSESAAFDRIARNAVRLTATSPAYGADANAAVGQIDALLQSAFDDENLSTSTSVSGGVAGHATFTMALDFAPTLFGLGLRDEVFGVALPRFHHEIALTVDPYKPGIFF